MSSATVHAESVDLRLSGARPLVQGARLPILLTLISILLAACAHHSAGVPYAPWELRGTIVEVRSDRVRVRHKSGQVVELTFDDRTAIVGAEGGAPVSALTHGRRVAVSVEPLPEGRARAATIRVFM